MKIGKNKKIISVMLLLSMILSIFIPTNQVFAKEIANAITKFSITDENDKPLGPVGQYDQFKIHGEFELEDNLVKKGDTTTIKLPDKLKIGDTMNFDLKDSEGNIVATAVVDKKNKTITLTYTDYSESRSGVNGSFYYYARVDSEVVTGKEKFPVEIEVEGEFINAGEIDYEGPSGKPADNYLFKGSDPDPINKNIIKYHMFINRSNKKFENLVITDKMVSNGVKVHVNTVRIQEGNWIWNNETGRYEFKNEKDVTNQYTVLEKDGGFSIEFGNIPAEVGFKIFYDGEITYTPVDGEKVYNEAKLDAKDEKTITTTREHVYREAGGQAEGYVYKIDILKKGENGEVLAGAEFEVIRERNSSVVGKIITDKDGKGSIEKLLKDKYILSETKAPNGYVLLKEDIVVEPGDFDSTTKIALKEITNKKVAPKPTELALKVNKNFTGKVESTIPFEFELKDDKNEVLQTKTINKTGEVLFDKISYDKVGEYKYTITEKKGTEPGISYDTHTVNVTVNVTDDGSGKLKAVEAYTGDTTFKNEYKAAETDIQFKINKNFTGKSESTIPFEFELKDDKNEVLQTKTINKTGEVLFDKISYDKVGEYKYTITEKKGTEPGISYDTHTVNVTVNVADDGSGKLKAVEAYTGDTTFKNEYKAAETDIQFKINKNFTGKSESTIPFEFELKDDKNEVLQTKTINKTGEVLFDKISYDKVGEYKYTITEKKGTEPGISYDTHTANVTVNVTDDGLGKLKAVEAYTGDTTFKNEYKAAETDIQFKINKNFTGKVESTIPFEFELKDDKNEVLQTKTINKTGEVLFDKISYDKVGEYKYTITEKKGTEPGISYDTHTVNVTVNVTDDGSGNLKAVEAYTGDTTFYNLYAQPISVKLDVTKILEGKALKANQFKFNIVGTSENTEDIKAFGLNDAKGRVEFKNLDLTFIEEGVYEYKVFETKGRDKKIVYDNAVYEIEIKITHNRENNILEPTVKITKVVSGKENTTLEDAFKEGIISLEFINITTDTVIVGDKNK